MELIPKIADLKLLRELSKVIIAPMLIAAYLIQSNFSIFGINVNSEALAHIQLGQFLLIFLISFIVVGASAWIIHDLLLYLHFFTNFIGLTILSTMFLAFGFLGIFGKDIPLIEHLNNMWFYTSFVSGFYLLARAADIEQAFT
jgi:hypothetical protein